MNIVVDTSAIIAVIANKYDAPMLSLDSGLLRAAKQLNLKVIEVGK